jgi:hypothetical protein
MKARTGSTFRAASFAFVSILCLAACSGPDASGTYVAPAPGEGLTLGEHEAVAMLTVVQMPDSRVSGEIRLVSIDEDGALISESSPFTGAINGLTVVLSIRSSYPWRWGTSATGKLTGEDLLLTGSAAGQPLAVTFARSDVSHFQEIVADLSKQSKHLVEAKARADSDKRVADQLTALVAELDKFNASKPRYLDGMSSVEKMYRDETTRIRDAAEKLRMPSDTQERKSAEVGMVSIATTNDSSQFAGGFAGIIPETQNDFETAVKALDSKIAQAAEWCSPAYSSSIPEIEIASQIKMACNELPDREAASLETTDEIEAGFSRVENTRKEQWQLQEQMRQQQNGESQNPE